VRLRRQSKKLDRASIRAEQAERFLGNEKNRPIKTIERTWKRIPGMADTEHEPRGRHPLRLTLDIKANVDHVGIFAGSLAGR
jgi:hypothetical protein